MHNTRIVFFLFDETFHKFLSSTTMHFSLCFGGFFEELLGLFNFKDLSPKRSYLFSVNKKIRIYFSRG